MLTQAFADLIALCFVRIREKKNEFFSTKSGNIVRLTQATSQCLGDRSEGDIAFGMDVAIIVGFEEINVGNGQGERARVSSVS